MITGGKRGEGVHQLLMQGPRTGLHPLPRLIREKLKTLVEPAIRQAEVAVQGERPQSFKVEKQVQPLLESLFQIVLPVE